MKVDKAIIHNAENLLNYEEIEHPIALQVGGSDPNTLGKVAQIAEDWGYDEINLNLGCPSSKVKDGNFGASLMSKPKLVAECVEKMTANCSLPITVKHRLGIDDLDNDQYLKSFISILNEAGAKRFIVHARKAWLSGLNPKENRNIPPLQYNRAEKIKKENPNLIIELNGGLDTPLKCFEALKIFDGVMVGRAIYDNPILWNKIDDLIFKQKSLKLKRSKIISNLIPHIDKSICNGKTIYCYLRHIMKLIKDIPHAKNLRKKITFKSANNLDNLNAIEFLINELRKEGF